MPMESIFSILYSTLCTSVGLMFMQNIAVKLAADICAFGYRPIPRNATQEIPLL
jgi:hypothetical protein